MWNRHIRRAAAFALCAELAAGTWSSAARAKRNSFTGTFGGRPFKAARLDSACKYTRAIRFFTIAGGQSKARKKSGAADLKFATISGTTDDPTATSTVFPIVLGDAAATFTTARRVGSGTDPGSFGGWRGGANDVVVTLTSYRHGRLTGTMTGTLAPGDTTRGGPIRARAKFVVSCDVE